jgi:hypothetical protein
MKVLLEVQSSVSLGTNRVVQSGSIARILGDHRALVYSNVSNGAEFMNIASELEKHAAQDLSQPQSFVQQIDHLGAPRPFGHQESRRSVVVRPRNEKEKDSKVSVQIRHARS